jgi:1,2-phenylacetyl-CoA epoxidase PaaB subunit
MIKTFGISKWRNPDGTWRWELHVPQGSQQDYMRGFSATEADAEDAAKSAQNRYVKGISK